MVKFNLRYFASQKQYLGIFGNIFTYVEPTRLQEPAIYSQILIKTLNRQGFRDEESSASQVLYLRNSCFYNYLETLVTKCWLIHFLLLVSPYM